MLIFDGVYKWDGMKSDDSFPVTWWPGSYRIRLIDIQAESPDVIFIKPYLCIFSGMGSEYSIKTRFERFAVKVADNFGIDPEKILWVENTGGEDLSGMDVAMLEVVTRLKNENIYKTVWRKIRPNELRLVEGCGLIEN